MNRLWGKETNAKRLELEKDILALLKDELALLERKRDLYKEYDELMEAAYYAYQDKTINPIPSVVK
tara:strand:+ start:2179 stop:2376 length:198 start_codon:yes stop_codon:yes gene_type:complete